MSIVTYLADHLLVLALAFGVILGIGFVVFMIWVMKENAKQCSSYDLGNK